MRNSNRSWGWDTMKAGVGADFIITPLYVLLRMGSDGPSGTVFPSLPAPSTMLDYQPRSRRRTSAREAAASARNDIIHTRSPRCGLTLPVNCSGSYLTVPSCGASRDCQSSASMSTSVRRSAGGNGWERVCQAPSSNSTDWSFNCDAAPVAWRSGGTQSTAALSSVLIAQHPKFPFVVPAQPNEAKTIDHRHYRRRESDAY